MTVPDSDAVLPELSAQERRFVALLYILMRDEVTPGKVARVVCDVPREREASFSNGHLAAYAREIVESFR